MKIKDFEKKIQDKFDKTLTIKTNPNAKDIAGVYWGEIYLGVSVPPVEIREEIDVNYIDGIGQPYKNIKLAEDFIVGKLEKYKKVMEEDPDLFKDNV